MAADKHTIKITDKDGNQSEVTLPGFALDITQEKLLKSMQALVRSNPKAQKAYEDLVGATKSAVTATEDASKQQKKDAKALQDAVETASDKQVSALKQFQTNFADRVGSDMRDTFTAGGNILTAAIKTATVGLAAGAGLLYKTFMDTSDAFRTLAQAGLGGAGASGTEAQDAVANLTRLGMTAGEAANMLTSFGQASAILGKANFSKFVSGIANSSTFAAELGLTLEEAAEFAAEEIDIRQRSLAGQMQLNEFSRQSVMESIEQTQRFAGVMGRSMKDINASKKSFLEDNSNINALMLRLSDSQSAKVNAQVQTFLGGAAAIGGDFEKLMQGILNAAAKQIPITDSNLQAIASIGPAGMRIVNTANKMSKELNAGDFSRGPAYMNQIAKDLAGMSDSERRILEIQAAQGNEVAAMIINTAAAAKKGGDALAKAFSATSKQVNDPMVTAGANFQNVIGQVTGAFTTVRNTVLGQFAGPINDIVKELTDSGLEKLTKEQRVELEAQVRAVKENNNLSEKEKEEKIRQLYDAKRTRTFMVALYEGLDKISKSFMQKFFPNLDKAGSAASGMADQLIKFIDDTAASVSKWISDLEGKTFGEKLKSAAIGMVKAGLGILWEAIKITAWEFLSSPMGWTLLMGLFTASLLKSLALSGLATLLGGPSKLAGTSAAASITQAGNTLANAIRQVAAQVRAAGAGLGGGGGRGRRGGRGGAPAGAPGGKMSNIAGKASLAGLVIGVGGGIAADELEEAGHTKTAAVVGTAANVASMAGTGAMIGSMIAPGLGTAVGAGLGAVAGLALSAYQQNWFGSDEAQKSIAEKGQEAIEGMDATGMAAMAMDPQHINAVSFALRELNTVSVDNIAAGLTTFNPVFTGLFETVSKVRIDALIRVNTQLLNLFNNLKNINLEALKLPVSSENLRLIGEQVAKMPVDGIIKLANAFKSFTLALKGFSDLTTDTRFGRMWDAFTGRQDKTESIIKVLNNFASKVDSEKLLAAANATRAYNAAMREQAELENIKRTSAAEVERSRIIQQNPTSTNTTSNTPIMNPYEKMETILTKIQITTDASHEALKKIRDNTKTTADNI